MILFGLLFAFSTIKTNELQFVVTSKIFGWTSEEIPASEIIPFVIAPEVIGWTTRDISNEYIATKDNYDQLMINFAQHHLQ